MAQEEKDTNTESNESLNTVEEKVKIGNDEVTLKITGEGEDAKYEVEAPEGKEDDAEFAKGAEEAISIYAAANLKGFKTNQAQEKLDTDRKALDKEKADWAVEKIRKTGESKIPSKLELVMKHLKITDPADLDAEDVSRADLYEAERKAETEINQARSQVTDSSKLITDFIAGGGDYNELINLSQALNAPISRSLINQLSKTSETRKPEFATTHLANIQKKQIHIVKKGNLQVQASAEKQRAKRIINVGNQQKRL